MNKEFQKNLEAHIFEKDNKILLNFLEQNYSVKYASEIELFENINTYKSISAYRKRILLSRLVYLEESHDLTAIFTGIFALILSLLGIYKVFLEEIMPIGIYFFTMVVIYVMCIGLFATSLEKEKGRRAKAKYFLSLFKDI